MRLYLDTSVFGGYFDEEFAESTIKLFQEIEKGEHYIVISSAVKEELELAPPKVAGLLAKIPESRIVEVKSNRDVLLLSKKYIDSKVISDKFEMDGLHVAVATIYHVDVIVSWNFKHLVNLNRIRGFNSVNLQMGYRTIDIRTPKEIIK